MALYALRNCLRWSIALQFAGFAGAGAVATTVHYLILIWLVQLHRTDPALASGIGATAGALAGYALNYRYVFRSTANHAISMARFFSVAGVGLILNTLCMWVAIDGFRLHYLPSQIIATGVVLMWNFALNRTWTFR